MSSDTLYDNLSFERAKENALSSTERRRLKGMVTREGRSPARGAPGKP